MAVKWSSRQWTLLTATPPLVPSPQSCFGTGRAKIIQLATHGATSATSATYDHESTHLARLDALLRAELLHIAVQQKKFRRIRGEPALPVHFSFLSSDQTSQVQLPYNNFARYLTRFISLRRPQLNRLATSHPQRVYPPISTQTIFSCSFLRLLQVVVAVSSNSRPLFRELSDVFIWLFAS